jgi:hypothetical protein
VSPGVSLFNETIRHIRISVAPAAANILPNIWNVAVEEVLVEPAFIRFDRDGAASAEPLCH